MEILPQLQLTESQRRGLVHLRALPHGLGLIPGPPGTGKTHFIVESLLPLVLTSQKVLVLSASNDPVDHLALAIKAKLKAIGHKHAGHKRVRIIRPHTSDTEFSVFDRQIELNMKVKPPHFPILQNATKEETIALSQFRTAIHIKSF